jgi:hypothetical protein
MLCDSIRSSNLKFVPELGKFHIPSRYLLGLGARRVKCDYWDPNTWDYLPGVMANSPWESDSHSVGQEIPPSLWNPMVHCSVHKSLQPCPVLSQLSTVHYFPYGVQIL